MTDHKPKHPEKNGQAIAYEQSHGQYGASMEMQAARAKAAEVAEHAAWCKLPQDVRDEAANEDRGNKPHVRDTSCDKPKGRGH